MKFPAVETSLIDVTDKLKTPFRVLYKKENEQPSGSFKLRGIGFLIGSKIEEARASGKKVCVFSSSGGNAGLAAAYSAQYFGVECTVVLPKTAKPSVADLLLQYGAKVEIKGEHWGEADAYLREEVIAQLDKETLYPLYCHPFDDPLVWQGHSSMISEIESQLSEEELKKVKCVICSVGGGGLFNGIVQGLKQSKYLKDLKVLSVEPKGAPCFDEAIKQQKVVYLQSVNSLATTLASPYVSEQTLKYYNQHPALNIVLDDLDTVQGSVDHYDTFSEIVEPACGATISMVTKNKDILLSLGPLEADDIVIAIVCGGKVTTEKDIDIYRNMIK